MESNEIKKFSTSNILKKALCYLLTAAMVISGMNMVPGAVIKSEAAQYANWNFITLEDGRYKISSVTGGVLYADGSGYVAIDSDTQTNAKRWIISKNANNSYKIRCVANPGGMLDIENTESGLRNLLPVAYTYDAGHASSIADTSGFRFGNVKSNEGDGYYIYCGNNDGDDYVFTNMNGLYTYAATNNDRQRWIFTPINYKVRFNQNGAPGSSYVQTIHYDNPTALEANEFTREGYTFAGWTKNQDGSGTVYSNRQTITDNLGATTEDQVVDLYAKWTKTQATITFDKNGGASGDASLVVTPGKAVPSINIPQKSNATFDGYYTDSTTSGKKIFDKNGNPVKNVSGYTDNAGNWIGGTTDINLIAKWVGQQYTITFNKDGGASGDDSLVVTTGEKVPSINIPQKAGFTFGGYKIETNTLFDENGVVKNVDPYTDSSGNWIGTSDITVSANWVLANSNIRFFKKVDDETPIETINISTGDNVPSVTVPTLAGSEFLGFYTKPSGSAEIPLFDTTGHPINATGFIQNGKWKSNTATVDVYAKWNVISCNVKFSSEVEKDFFAESNTYSGRPNDIIKYVEEDLSDYKCFTSAPTRKGYTFAGFADELTGGTLVIGADGKIAATDVKSSLNGQIIKGGKWVLPGEITLYAQWTPVKYNFTFDKNTGDGNNVTINDVDISKGYPATVTIAKQSKPGQQLIGFAATADATADDLIYKASADDTTKFEFIEDSITARPESTDITLYAIWGTSEYQVAYYDRDWNKIDDEGATIDNVSTSRINEGVQGVENPQEFKYGQFMLQSLKELNYNPGEKVTSNYSFLGWSTKPYAKKADYEAGKQYQGGLTTTPGEIVNLYAVWVKTNGADISYNGNGSLDAPATHVPADDEVIFDKEDEEGKKYAIYKIEPKYQPIREGYTFLGWSKSATDTENLYVPGAEGVEVPIYEDTVFYAQWKINPQITYDAGSGSFTEKEVDGKMVSNAIPAVRYPAGTNGNLISIVDPREGNIIQRPGYTFAGWTAIRADGVEDATLYCSKPDTEVLNKTLAYEMPDCDIVLRAKWTKKTYRQMVVADYGSDVYTISYTGTYNDEGTITKVEGDEEKVDVVLEKAMEGLYFGATDPIPHEANIILSLTVDGKYNAEGVDVTVNGAKYKPVETTVETVEETVAEDKLGATTFKYRIDDITNSSFYVTIDGAKPKNYTVQYKTLNSDAVVPDTALLEYNAGDVENLVPAADTDKYEFAGWYTSEDAAKTLDAEKKVDKIAANFRGNKTYYAGWQGKKYKVTFDKLYGTKKADGAAADEDTQQFAFGEEQALKTFAEAFPGTLGPNSVSFLGWATSEEDAFAHKVTYTDGQSVKDIAVADDPATGDVDESEVKLWAVWDIDKVTVSFNTNGGEFADGKIVDTQSISYGKQLVEAITQMTYAAQGSPMRTGFEFKNWATKPNATVSDVDPTEKQYVDITLYAVWSGDARTLNYYKDNEGSVQSGESVKTKNGEKLIVGMNGQVPVEVTVPDGKVHIGWASQGGSQKVVYAQGEEIIITSDVQDFYPVFADGETYLLSYNSNGGKFRSVPDTQTLVQDPDDASIYRTEVAASSYVPERKGYIFVGWSEDKNIAVDATEGIYQPRDTFEYKVPAVEAEKVYSHTLYAIWKPISYSVVFNANKAPKLSETDGFINYEAANQTAPALIAEAERDARISDATAESYKQSFIYDKADTFAPVQYEYPGYVFKGWAESADGNVVYKNIQDVLNMESEVDGKVFTVYAIWAMDTPLTVSYRANGGILKQITPEAGQAPVDVKAPADQKYVRIADTINVDTAAAVYVRDGYKFLGWSTSSKTYKFKEDVPQGAYIDPASTYEQTYVSTTTTVTLYAVWQKLPTYKVVYNHNEGAGSVPIDLNEYHIDTDNYLDDKIQNHNTVTIDASVVPVRTGYTFLGWANKAEKTEGDESYKFYEYVPATGTSAATYNPAEFEITASDDDQAENIIDLYAVWQANTYTINFFKVDKTDSSKRTKIGEQTFKYDDATGKLIAVADMEFTPEVEEGQQSVTNKYEATPGYIFAGWSFKPLGTLSLEDEASIMNLLTGADEHTKVINLFAVEIEKKLKVTLNDDFETIGKNFIDDADEFKNLEDKSFYEFYEKTWGKVNVNIKKRALDDKVALIEEGDEGYDTATDLEKYGIDNAAHKYLVKYTRALNDITVPKAPGFVFKGYFNGDTMYYDASGNAVKNADFTDDVTLTAKWEPIEFKVIFKENGEKIDEATVTYGATFKMPNTVRHLSYNSDKEVVGWTTSVDNQNPPTAAIDGMEAYSVPDKFLLNTSYSAIIIAKLYNNYNADITMYPIYKTTRKYKVFFSTVDQTRVTNLPETQIVSWQDTFKVIFDDTEMRTPKREGYTFLGWSRADSAEEAEKLTVAEFPYPVDPTQDYDIKNVEDNITLYAVWKANTYKVEYYDAEEKKVEDIVTYPNNVIETSEVDGEPVETVKPYEFCKADVKDADDKLIFTKTGYKLAGWSLDEKAETVDYAPGQKLDKALATGVDGNDTVKLYAVWTAGDYTVKFEKTLNSATGTMADQAMAFDKSSALNKNLFEAEGYKFAGWAIATKAGDEIVIPSEAEYKDGQNVNLADKLGGDNLTVTLFAIWTPDIKAEDKTVVYPAAPITITDMFTIPDGVGNVTYTLKDNTADAVLEDTKLKVTKPGTFVILAATEKAAGITAAEAEAKITVTQAEGKGTIKIMDGTGTDAREVTLENPIAYADAKDITPVVDITEGDQDLESAVTCEYKLITAGDDAYASEVPTKAGEYIARATVADGTLYKGFVATAKFAISDKTQAAGTVNTYAKADDEEPTNEFVKAEGLEIIPKVTFTKPVGDDAADAFDIEYQYKVTKESDDTFTTEQPKDEGEYVVRAVVTPKEAFKDKYVGFTTANQAFKIVISSEDAEAAAKEAAIEAAKKDVLKRFEDTYTTLATSGKYSQAELNALLAAYEAGCDELIAKIDALKDSAIGSGDVQGIAETYLVLEKIKLSDAVQDASTREAAEAALAEAVELITAAAPIITNEDDKYIADDVKAVKDAKEAVDAKVTELNNVLAQVDPEADSEEIVAKADALKTASAALDEAIDAAELHRIIAEAVMDQENIQPFVKRVAKDSLTEYVERLKPEDLTAEEEALLNAKLEEAIAMIDAAENNEAVMAALKDAKTYVKEEAIDVINAERAADAAVADAKEAAKIAEALAEAAEKEAAKYELTDDIQAIDDAVAALDDAMDELDAAETVEAKEAAAKAVQDAVDALNDATATAMVDAAVAEAAEKEAADAEAQLKAAKQAAYDRLDDYAGAKAKSDASETEKSEYETAVNDGKALIDAADKDTVLDALAAAKAKVDAALAKIDGDRAADAAVADAKAAADAAISAAEAARADSVKYELTDDVQAIDDAILALNEAKAAFNTAETAEQKNAAAKAVQDAAEALNEVTVAANANSAAAKAAEDEEAAAAAELATAIQAAKDRLDDYADAKALTDAIETEKAEYKAAVDAAKAAIDDAKTTDDVLDTLVAGKQSVDAIIEKIKNDRADTAADKEATEALEGAREAAEDALDDAEEALDNDYVSDEDAAAIEAAVEALEKALNDYADVDENSDTAAKEEAAQAIDDAIEALEEAVEDALDNAEDAQEAEEIAAKELSDAKQTAKERLEDMVDAKNQSDYREDQQAEIAKAKEDGEKAIDEATTSEEVAQALADAKKAINEVKTDSQMSKEEAEVAKKNAEAAKKAEDAIKKIPDSVTEADEAKIAAARNAYDSLTEDQKKLVSNEALAKLVKAEADVKTAKATAAQEATALALNSKLKVTQTGSKINVSYGAVQGADEYRVYVQYCGKKFKSQATATVPASTLKVSINKINGKKLNLKKNFKVYVAAYKTVNGKKVRMGKTITAHVVGRKNATYTNAKKITIKSSKAVTLTVGGTSKIKAKTTLVNKKKKQLTNAHAKQFRYKSTNKKVATVSSKGKIKAVGKGTCTIYVYSRNGLAKTVTVTVN